MKTFDAAIIGGGLAGLTLSIQLAKSGKRVVVFERHKFPFHKVCGEYIAMESWNFLEKCGVPLSEMNLPRITQLKVSAPDGKYLNHNLNPGGFGISRLTLDNMLAELAIKASVTLVQGTKVFSVKFENNQHEISTGNENYTAAVVAGAFGKHSNLDTFFKRDADEKLSSKKNYVGIKYHVKADLPENQIDLHNFEDGYCGISKVEKERYCLCYLTSSENLHKNDNDIEKMESAILMKNLFLNKYFSEYEKTDGPFVISQISFEKKSLIEDHVLMMGDAAGMIAPLCGNGMSMAMHASAIAASLINSFLEDKISRKEMEQQYKTTWNKAFSFRLSAGRKIQSLFGKSFLTNQVIRSLKNFPSVVNSLVGLTHGKGF
jgi:flavin-dependent dehydrogenase